MPDPAIPIRRVAWRGDAEEDADRQVAVEVPVALTYNRATHAVMLASPSDLEDFAVGFSLSEQIIADPSEILGLEIVELPNGIECRMDLAHTRHDTLIARQRRLAGPSGCGLCGLDSLTAAIRPVPRVPEGRVFTAAMIRDAMASMHPAQLLNQETRAMHAAGFWTPERGLVVLREDVGRHNALDKLSGAMARAGQAAEDGIAVLSSRVSVEMAQKAAILGAPVLVAVSAPTSLAIEIADTSGITLIGIARPDGFEVFTHLQRIDPGKTRHVA